LNFVEHKVLKIYEWLMWEHIKLGELPWHIALGFLLLGEIPQNTQRNKKGVVYDTCKIQGVNV
jgi:hypothetical protein